MNQPESLKHQPNMHLETQPMHGINKQTSPFADPTQAGRCPPSGKTRRHTARITLRGTETAPRSTPSTSILPRIQRCRIKNSSHENRHLFAMLSLLQRPTLCDLHLVPEETKPHEARATPTRMTRYTMLMEVVPTCMHGYRICAELISPASARPMICPHLCTRDKLFNRAISITRLQYSFGRLLIFTIRARPEKYEGMFHEGNGVREMVRRQARTRVSRS